MREQTIKWYTPEEKLPVWGHVLIFRLKLMENQGGALYGGFGLEKADGEGEAVFYVINFLRDNEPILKFTVDEVIEWSTVYAVPVTRKLVLLKENYIDS